MALPLTENDFQRRVVALAHQCQWLVHHTHTVQINGAYRTPIVGDRGLPDLILARDGALILAELKTDKGRLGPGQADWLTALGPHARLWRPRDWPAIMAELGAPRSPGRPATQRQRGSEGDRRRHGGAHVPRRYTGFGAAEHGQHGEQGSQRQPGQRAAPARWGSRSGVHGA